MRAVFGILAAFLAAVSSAYAQNMGGVFPPIVNPDTAQLEYRIGYRDDNGAEDAWKERVHFQASPTDDLLWRVVAQTNNLPGESEFDLFQAELFWDLSDHGDRWRTGMRFDVVVRNGDRPEQINVNWTNQIALTPKWNARFVVLTSTQLGDRAADGVGIETRANLFTKRGGITMGLESYNLHGRTSDFEMFSGRQQFGPFAVWPVTQKVYLRTGLLFGMDKASPDTDFRLWLGKNF